MICKFVCLLNKLKVTWKVVEQYNTLLPIFLYFFFIKMYIWKQSHYTINHSMVQTCNWNIYIYIPMFLRIFSVYSNPSSYREYWFLIFGSEIIWAYNSSLLYLYLYNTKMHIYCWKNIACATNIIYVLYVSTFGSWITFKRIKGSHKNQS